MLAYIDGAYRGSSTDRAAMSDDVIRNQEAFIEVDTGNVYFFDAEGKNWVKFGGSTNSSSSDGE